MRHCGREGQFSTTTGSHDNPDRLRTPGLAKANAVQGVGAAGAERGHLFGCQARIDELQKPLVIHEQPAEEGRFAEADVLLALVFGPGHHPEDGLGGIQATLRLGIDLIPAAADARQQKPKQRRIIPPPPLLPMHRRPRGISVLNRLRIPLMAIVATGTVPDPVGAGVD